MERPTVLLSKYEFRNLAWHVYQAGRYDDLYALIEHPEWHRSKSEIDPTQRLFRDDVELALDASHQVAQAVRGKVLPLAQGMSLVPRLVAHSLLYASVGAASRYLPLDVIEALALLGDVDRAIQYTDLITDAESQADAYRRIGLSLYGQGNAEKAQELLASALMTASTMVEDVPWAREKVISALTQAYIQIGVQGQAAKVLGLVQDATQTWDGECSVIATMALLGEYDAAELRARAIPDESYRAQALATICIPLAAAGQRETARSIVEEIGAVDIGHLDSDERLRVQSILAQVVAELGDDDRALAIAGEIEPLAGRLQTQVAVVGVLMRKQGPEATQQTLELTVREAESLETPYARASLLCAVADTAWYGGLAGYAREVAIEAQSIAEPVAGNLGLDGNVALTMARVGFATEARAAIDRIIKACSQPATDWEEIKALCVIVTMLSNLGDTARLLQVIPLLAEVQDGWQRAELTAALAEALHPLDPAKEQTLVNGLVASAEEAVGWQGAPALAVAGRTLSRLGRAAAATHLIDTAIQRARDVPEPDERAEALISVTETFGEGSAASIEEHLVEETLVAIEAVEDENFAAYLVALLIDVFIQQPHEGVLERLRAVAENLEDNWLSAEAKFAISRALAQTNQLAQAWGLWWDACALALFAPETSAEQDAGQDGSNITDVLNQLKEIEWPSTFSAGVEALFELVPSSIGNWRAVLEAPIWIPPQFEARRMKALTAMARRLAPIAKDDPLEIFALIWDIFNAMRTQNSSAVWSCIGALYPLIATAGDTETAIATWDRIYHIRAMLSQ